MSIITIVIIVRTGVSVSSRARANFFSGTTKPLSVSPARGASPHKECACVLREGEH